ncbi:MAG: hypothetical protein OEL20_04900 [Sulfuritalea sp.]|nr:hypothetical protein [Sulfuritalea sp.]
MKQPLVGFEFNGAWIVNPFETEYRRGTAHPSYYGFTPTRLVDGRAALHKGLPAGGYILITAGTHPMVSPSTPPEHIVFTLYNKDGERLAHNTLAEAVQDIKEKLG